MCKVAPSQTERSLWKLSTVTDVNTEDYPIDTKTMNYRGSLKVSGVFGVSDAIVVMERSDGDDSVICCGG